MTSARFIVGDTRDVVRSIPDGSVDLILTSPPFLALRSYLPADHADKAAEIGSEPNPEAFVAMMLELSAEWRRVLAPHGSLCVELGDTYSGSGGGGGDYLPGGMRAGQTPFAGSAASAHFRTKEGITRYTREDEPPRKQNATGWPLAKSLSLIPELYRVGLVYGVNPLSGALSPAGRWRARNVVRWVRSNPPVGALADKFRPATSEMVVACTSASRWFDGEAVRGEASPNTHSRSKAARFDTPSQQRDGNWSTLAQVDSDPAAGAPPLDWWLINPAGFDGSHYATFPPDLCVRPILSMCPRRVCRTCGEPSRRHSEITGLVDRSGRQVEREVWASGVANGAGAHTNKTTSGTTTTTTGWSTCGCPDTDGLRLDGFHEGAGWRNGVVLDPFAGTFTVGQVAHGHGRDSIGIDLDERNVVHAETRLGMWLTVETGKATT